MGPPNRRVRALAAHVLPGAPGAPGAPGPVGANAVASEESDIDVDRVAYGFMASQALFSALELGIFDHAAASAAGATIQELQKATGVAAPRLQTLVTALAAVGALRRSGAGRYTPSPNAARYLVRSSRQFYGDYLRMQIGRQFYQHMGGLPEVMKTGKAVDYATLFSDPAEADLYTRAQHNGSLATARQLCKWVDFSGMGSMLDIGGGSGAFSIVICQKNPAMRAVVLEFPEVCKSAAAFVNAEPREVAERITYVPGSCLDPWPAELGSGHDAVLISYVSESVPAPAVPELYKAAFQRLKPGGMLIVHSFMVDDSLDGPELGALWSLQHVAVNAEGLGLAPGAVSQMMRGAGFAEVSHRDMIGGMTKLVLGRRPA